MTRDHISTVMQSLLHDYFSDFGRSPVPEFAMSNHLVNTYGADSLDVLEVVMTVEDEFNIEIDDETAEKLMTVENYIDYLSTVLKDKE